MPQPSCATEPMAPTLLPRPWAPLPEVQHYQTRAPCGMFSKGLIKIGVGWYWTTSFSKHYPMGYGLHLISWLSGHFVCVWKKKASSLASVSTSQTSRTSSTLITGTTLGLLRRISSGKYSQGNSSLTSFRTSSFASLTDVDRDKSFDDFIQGCVFLQNAWSVKVKFLWPPKCNIPWFPYQHW